MLEDFMNHKLLIRITGATIDELKKLDNVIQLPYLSGDKIYEKYTDTKAERYLHHRAGKDGVSFSEKPVDVFDENRPIPFINYYELTENNMEISSEEIEELFV